MHKLFKSFTVMMFTAAALFSCGSSTQPDKNSNITTATASNNGKVYFSCKVDGAVITDNTDGGILDPLTGKLLTTGESENYIVGIRIPPDLKAGQSCDACKGFVHKKIKHEGGITENRIYERVQNITVTLSKRSKGYAAGTFSFSVKLKEDSDTKITVTDGSFGMNIINDN